MKVNIILPLLGQSGGQSIVIRYARELKHRGHDVSIYSPLWGLHLYRYHNHIINFIYEVYCLIKGLKECWHIKGSREVIYRVSDSSVRDADIIIATAWPTAFNVNELSSNKGEKFYFIQGFEIWDNQERGLESYKLPLHKIVISKWINDQLSSYLGMEPSPVVYDGLDIIGKNFLPYDKFNILMLNHKLPKKGVNYGIEAFRIVKNKIPNVHLTMFGMCSSDNLPNDLDINYYRNPSATVLQKLYKSANIFIFPSLEEGWGLTPLEAMCNNTVVVGTSVGFARELGHNRINMMISEPADIVTMANNIIEVLNNETLRFNIADQAYNLVSQMSWDKATEKLESIIDEYID